MRETELTRKLIAALESRGAFTMKVHGHAMQRPGIPDLYVAHAEFQGWVELKVGDGRLSTLQLATIRELAQRGVSAMPIIARGNRVYVAAPLKHNAGPILAAAKRELDAMAQDTVYLEHFLGDPLRYLAHWWEEIRKCSAFSRK